MMDRLQNRIGLPFPERDGTIYKARALPLPQLVKEIAARRRAPKASF